jgi:hypothetical protein
MPVSIPNFDIFKDFVILDNPQLIGNPLKKVKSA